MESEGMIQLGWVEMVWLLVMVCVVVVISVVMRLGFAKDVVVGTCRATVQLLCVGLVIGWVFEQRVWYAVLGLLLVMTLVAGMTGARRTGLSGIGWVFCAVLGLVTFVTLMYLGVVVVGLGGWEARYLIPLGGMVLGNAMTAGTLTVERFVSELKVRRGEVEALLALGASVGEASGGVMRSAIGAALTPTLNTMMVVGVVTLPGMMTGQMLGGSDPFQAAMYQLLILVGILFCAAMTATAMGLIVRGRFFTDADQLDARGWAEV